MQEDVPATRADGPSSGATANPRLADRAGGQAAPLGRTGKASSEGRALSMWNRVTLLLAGALGDLLLDQIDRQTEVEGYQSVGLLHAHRLHEAL